MHAPWNPGKVERKRREAERRRRENLARRGRPRDENGDLLGGGREGGGDGARTTWDPTPEEVAAWEVRVAELTSKVGAEVAAEVDGATAPPPPSPPEGARTPKRRREDDGEAGPKHRPVSGGVYSDASEGRMVEGMGGRAAKRPRFDGVGVIATGRDRNGNRAEPYRKSLPPFLKAAADGDADAIRSAIEGARGSGGGGNSAEVLRVLDERDRNGSIAEHWAAGGGHMNCLRLLFDARVEHSTAALVKSGDSRRYDDGRFSCSGTVRRRDGKTALHYAARNGRVECIDYLLRPGRSAESPPDVDVPAGDRTTPLHLACYGGHLPVVRLLVGTYGADPRRANDWGCDAAHWAAMSINSDKGSSVAVCTYLRWDLGVPFHLPQRQGHTPLHKAAQRKNREIVEWIAWPKTQVKKCDGVDRVGGARLTAVERKKAGRPDEGGNTPSDIWRKVGGDEGFADWMQDECGL